MRTSPLLRACGTSRERNSTVARPFSGTSTCLVSVTRPLSTRETLRVAFLLPKPTTVADPVSTGLKRRRPNDIRTTGGSAAHDQLFSSSARLKIVNQIVMALLLAVPLAAAEAPAAAPATAAKPAGCAGSATLGTFQLSVRPFSQGSPLPLKSVTAIRAGARLLWNPVHLPPQASRSAEVTAVLVPEASDGILVTLEPRKAGKRTEWQLLQRPQVIALVYGPQGLNEGKVKSLVTRDQDLLRQLADYAEQSSQVESLVQE